MKPLAAAATLAAATLALAGCHTTVPAFGPWPVGYRATDLEPGLWAAVAPTPACKWLIRGPLGDVGGNARAVSLYAGTTFESSGCGGFVRVNGGEGRT